MRDFLNSYLLLAGMLFLLFGCDGQPGDHHKERPASGSNAAASSISPADYTLLKKKIDSSRHRFYRQFQYGSAQERDSLLQAVRKYWIATAGTRMFNAWKGTPWDFQGTTQVPGEGSIACGYFVTTLLRDMGYPLNRVKLAICPSLTMMKTLCPGEKILNLSSLSYEGFMNRMKLMDSGIFVIGLDFHTGLLLHDGKECWFIHSNYIRRSGVMKELLGSSSALRASKTRFVLPLTASNAFLKRWFAGGSH